MRCSRDGAGTATALTGRIPLTLSRLGAPHLSWALQAGTLGVAASGLNGKRKRCCEVYKR